MHTADRAVSVRGVWKEQCAGEVKRRGSEVKWLHSLLEEGTEEKAKKMGVGTNMGTKHQHGLGYSTAVWAQLQCK